MDWILHYGVKGMKWGVRRTPEQLGHKKVLKKLTKRGIEKGNLLKELADRHEKFDPSAIHGITRMKDGRIAWLETGTEKAGLQHILKRHRKDFRSVGIPESKLPRFLMTALEKGTFVKKQGRSREIYEVLFEGKVRRVAIELGPNGFIVGANPKSSVKLK